ncbi:hypothetical protein MPH_12975 [Macrophomina phaseolina MS6]|uniref:Uncharacterized protein n=1 Tax=Macrophomina phaseolina (strain MS6) TaxID=1126212 RepID=K2R6R9_MACPH|nr:hypothetical protein MPH_12975 [Macrophomina phaseolina MS6]
MQHSKSDVFQRHYLPRYISADTQAAYRGMAPQSAVMRAVSGMRRSIDPRRPRKLTAEQSASIERHPRVVELYGKRNEIIRNLAKAKHTRASSTALSRLRSARLNATLAYRREKRQQKQALLEKVKKEFDRDQAIADIQSQLLNQPVDTIRQTLGGHLSLPRARVYRTLFTLPESTSEKEKHRRLYAIAALVVLCGAEENNPTCSRTSDCFPEKGSQRYNHTAAESIAPLARIGGSCPPQRRLTQCFLCLGDRELSMQKRTKEFYSRKDLEKHLSRHHLRCTSEKSVTVCPIDGQKLFGYSELIDHWRSSH